MILLHLLHVGACFLAYSCMYLNTSKYLNSPCISKTRHLNTLFSFIGPWHKFILKELNPAKFTFTLDFDSMRKQTCTERVDDFGAHSIVFY